MIVFKESEYYSGGTELLSSQRASTLESFPAFESSFGGDYNDVEDVLALPSTVSLVTTDTGTHRINNLATGTWSVIVGYFDDEAVWSGGLLSDGFTYSEGPLSYGVLSNLSLVAGNNSRTITLKPNSNYVVDTTDVEATSFYFSWDSADGKDYTLLQLTGLLNQSYTFSDNDDLATDVNFTFYNKLGQADVSYSAGTGWVYDNTTLNLSELTVVIEPDQDVYTMVGMDYNGTGFTKGVFTNHPLALTLDGIFLGETLNLEIYLLPKSLDPDGTLVPGTAPTDSVITDLSIDAQYITSIDTTNGVTNPINLDYLTAGDWVLVAGAFTTDSIGGATGYSMWSDDSTYFGPASYQVYEFNYDPLTTTTLDVNLILNTAFYLSMLQSWNS
ncbi:MAG: hypothetical protein PF447_09425, partial [Spirochaetaceae bacterium]|nr:hypothetical protein [Spirochaetaceae bacterium]